MLRILLDVLHFTIPIHHTMRVLPFLGICRISAIRMKIACPATDQLSRHSVLALLVQEHRCTEVCCRMDAHTHGATEVLQFSAFWLVLWRWRWPFYAYDWFIIIRFVVVVVVVASESGVGCTVQLGGSHARDLSSSPHIF